MSVTTATKFLEAVRDNAALQKELRTLKANDFDGLVKAAAKHSFEAFSKEDYLAAARAVGGEWIRWAAALVENKPTLSEELSEADLEQVAGGKGAMGTLNNCKSYCKAATFAMQLC